MAAPTLKQEATKTPPPPNKFQRAIDIGGAACLKEGSFPGDSWIAGLSVWGAEANWGKKWFDHQFSSSKPQLVCHLSSGQKFYYCLTELQGLPQGAELFAEFSAQWQKQIDKNAATLDPAGCNGQRNQPLNYATVDDFSICAPGQTQESGTAVVPSFAVPESQEASLTPEAAAAIAAKEAADAASKKSAAAAAAAAKAQIECRPLALWRYWFQSSNGEPSSIIASFTAERLASMGVFKTPSTSNELSYDQMVLALMSGKKVAGYNLQQIFPPDGWTVKKSKGTTVKHKSPIPYGQSTWAKAIALAYKDPELVSSIFAKCPTSQDDEQNGITDTDTDAGPMGGGAMLALAALALWAVRK